MVSSKNGPCPIRTERLKCKTSRLKIAQVFCLNIVLDFEAIRFGYRCYCDSLSNT